MFDLLITLVVMILALAIIDGFAAHILGDSEKSSKIFSGILVIFVLYMIMVGIIGSGEVSGFVSDGIPFVPYMKKDTTLMMILSRNPDVFVFETAELISLMFVISYLEKLISLNNSKVSLIIITRLVIVLVGVIINCFLISFISRNPIYRWALTCLECVISGTAITITPIMFFGKLLNVGTNNKILIHVIDKLPNTRAGQALSKSVSGTAVFLVCIMISEAIYGPLFGIVDSSIQIVYAFGPVVIMIIGIYMIVRSVFNGRK